MGPNQELDRLIFELTASGVCGFASELGTDG
jgi:hypothetical protein